MNNIYQIPIINNLRGIAALLVCLFHFVNSVTGYVVNPVVLNVFHYGSYGVQLFFVISGIVIPLSLLKFNYSIVKWPKFFLKRITRIEPPYLVAILVAILLFYTRRYFMGNHPALEEVNFKQVLLHLGYLIPFFKGYDWLNTVFWTLGIEFQYYLIISLLILLIIHGKILGRIVFYVIFISMPFCLPASKLFFPYHAPLFLMGITWCLYFLKRIHFFEFILVIIISTYAVYLKIGTIDALVGILTVTCIHFFKTLSLKQLNFFGDISYSLYLFHPLTGLSVINLLSHSFTEFWQKPFVVLAGLIVAILFSYMMYRLIEKPSQLISKRITYS